jgi:hypothetical protein
MTAISRTHGRPALRVIGLPNRTAAVRDLLLREPGATHGTVLAGVRLASTGRSR